MHPSARLLFALAALGTASQAWSQTTPKAYLFVNLDVHDPATFARYREAVPAVIEKFGGRFLVAGAEGKLLEGKLPLKRVAIIEFPSAEAVEKYEASPEYLAIKEFRIKSAHSDIIEFQGVPPR
jgi:uncharacterized protein (DUF1330 family)